MYRVIIISLLSFISIYGYSQVKRGNKLFDKFHYSEAIKIYDKDVDSKDAQKSFEATSKMALCYLYINDVENAAYWLNKTLNYEQAEPITHYYLANILVMKEEYKKAETHYLKHASLDNENAKSKAYAKFCREIHTIGTNNNIKIKNATILNSEYSDHSPIKFKNNIAFSTDRDINRTDVYRWTNSGFHQIYIAQDKSSDIFSLNMESPKFLERTFNRRYHSGPVSISKDKSRYFITLTLKDRKAMSKKNDFTSFLTLYWGNITNGEGEKMQEFPFNNNHYSVGHAALSEDGNMIIYSADTEENRENSNFYTSEYVDDKWTEPILLSDKINSFGQEVFPFLLNDSTLYFSSDGHLGYGGLDCFVSYKVNNEWQKPQNLQKPINSSYDDFGIYYLENGNEGFVSSNRPDGLGSDDIYVFKGATPEYICGYIKDKATNKGISNAHLFAKSSNSQLVDIAVSNDDGYFRIPFYKSSELSFRASKLGYQDEIYYYQTTIYNSDKPCIEYDLLLGNSKPDSLILEKKIYYNLDMAFIREDASKTLDSIIDMLNNNQRYLINVSSHTDNRASEYYNLDLSYRRAESVQRYFNFNGITQSRIILKGHGERKPYLEESKNNTLSEGQHQKNRRSEIKVMLPLSNTNNYDINYNKYKNGDIVPVHQFPINFFKQK